LLYNHDLCLLVGDLVSSISAEPVQYPPGYSGLARHYNDPAADCAFAARVAGFTT